MLAAPLPFHLPLSAPKGVVTFTVTVTVVTSTTLPALTLPPLLLCGQATLPAVLFKFLVVQLVAHLSHTTAAQWASVQSTVQVEGAAVAPLHPRCSLIAGIRVRSTPLSSSFLQISIAPALVVWSTTLFPCRETVRGALGARWGCRQLFGPARSPSLCVQETQSPLMETLPPTSPSVTTALLEVMGFLFLSSIHSSPIPQIADLQSLCCVWSQVSSAFARSTPPHVGISVDARVEFWRTLAGSVHRVSHTHPGLPMLLGGNSNVWLPPFQLGQSRQADSSLVPSFRR